MPELSGQVRSQAFIYLGNGDQPYQSSAYAMSYWPEKEIAIGIRLNAEKIVEMTAAFGTEMLFSGQITYNAMCCKSVVVERIRSKGG